MRRMTPRGRGNSSPARTRSDFRPARGWRGGIGTPLAQPLPEFIGGPKGSNQLGRKGLAGLDMPGEALQNSGARAPLLQHLRGRLDEIPLGADAGNAGPARPPAEDVVQQMSELVEERHHFGMLEQARRREAANPRAIPQHPAPHTPRPLSP